MVEKSHDKLTLNCLLTFLEYHARRNMSVTVEYISWFIHPESEKIHFVKRGPRVGHLELNCYRVLRSKKVILFLPGLMVLIFQTVIVEGICDKEVQSFLTRMFPK